MNIAQDNARIRDLPIIPRPNQAWADQFTLSEALPRPALNLDGGPFALNVAQAWALFTYRHWGGYVCPVSVGGGKTLISFSTFQTAFKERGHRKGMLLIKPSLLEQTLRKQLPWIRARMPLEYPIHVVAGKPRAQRQAIVSSDAPGLYIVAYTQLSTEDAQLTLEGIKPTVIVADEAHILASDDSGRNKRLWAVLGEVAKTSNVEFGFLTGTLTRKKLADFRRLMVTALKENAPVPLLANNCEIWDQWLSTENQRGVIGNDLSWLTHWARKNFPEEEIADNIVGARTAFRLRFETAPGVVTSLGQSCSLPLTLENDQIPDPPADYPGWKELGEMVHQLETLAMLPSGELVATPMHVWTAKTELATGFYNYLYWPTEEKVCETAAISLPEARARLHRSMDWLTKQQAWASSVFRWISEAPLGHDTELQVRKHIWSGEPHGIPGDVVEAYHEMAGADFEERIDRISAYKWVCPWKLYWVADRVKALIENGGVLVWAYNRAAQIGMMEVLERYGLSPILVNPQNKANQRLLEDPRNRDRVFVLSTRRCQEGLELQHFHQAVYLQTPRQGPVIEQSLGRMHRQGQTRDCLASMPMGLDHDHDVLGAALIEATYIHQTGSSQKACIAAWSPPPKLPPPELLMQRVPHLGNFTEESAMEYLRRFVG